MIALSQLAKMLGVEVRGPSADVQSFDVKIAGLSSIRQAAPGMLVFADDPASFAAAAASSAAAVLVSPQVVNASQMGDKDGEPEKLMLLCAQPRLAFARAAKVLAGLQASPADDAIHPTAVLSPEAQLGENVTIGAQAVVDAHAHIGRGSVIGSGAVIGEGVVIGSHCRIYPRVVIYPGTLLGDRVIVHAGAVLGGDGFGYVRDSATGEYTQFPQQGKLVIEDDVEIGANTTIDRGALEETRIARGAKIDNLVHIGHNVSIGRNAVIAAQTGISGSSGVGDNAILGGQVGIGDHAFVGEGVILGGQSGILPHKTLEGPGMLFWGTPAQPVKRYLRQLGMVARLGRPSKKSSMESSRESSAESSMGRGRVDRAGED